MVQVVENEKLIATPPSATIIEQLNIQHMTKREFGQKMQMNKHEVNQLLNGQMAIDTELAKRLESVLGVPRSFWLNLEKIYREKIQKICKRQET